MDVLPFLVSLRLRRSEVDELAELLAYVLKVAGAVLQLITLSRFLDPQPDNIIKKVFWKFLGGNSSSYLGSSSDRCIMVYICSEQLLAQYLVVLFKWLQDLMMLSRTRRGVLTNF